MNCKFLITSILIFLCAGCQTVKTIVKPVLTEEGEVYVYMMPLPQEANGLKFSIEQISAVRSDGVEVPLAITKKDFDGSEAKRQRFVASGRLLPGLYRGLNFKAGSAFLKGETGDNRLVVQEKPEFNDLPFEVRRKKGVVIDTALRFRESVGKGSGFIPSFFLSIPPRPLNSLIGYVTNSSANSITIFDKRNGEVMGMIPTGKDPKTVLFDRSRLLAYVVISGEDAIDVIDLQSFDVINRIRMNTGDNPSDAVLTPDGKTLLVVNEGSNTLSSIDSSSVFETTRTNVGNRPRSIVIDPTGSTAYVFNFLSNTISVVNIAGMNVVAQVTTESNPVRGELSKKGDRLFIFHDWSPNIIVYDTSSFAVVRRIYAGIGVSFIKVDDATDRLYVAKKHDPIINIFNPFSDIPMDFLKARGGACHMLIDDEDNNMLLLLPDQKELQSINLVSKKSGFLVDTGDVPYWSSIIGER
jgi:YVTN family beta-propeller protein